MAKRGNSKARIVTAAMELAESDGLLNITLDRVAEKSGLSKGGVLHHFRSKDDLLEGVIAHFSEVLDEHLTRLAADDPEPRFRWLRAMLTVTSAETGNKSWNRMFGGTSQADGGRSGSRLDRFMLSILAVAVHNPQLIQPIRDIGTRLRERLMSDADNALEQLQLWLMMDGLFLWQFVGLISPDDPLIEQIRRRITDEISGDQSSGTE